jgi:iron complex transport system substrate-binding protein
MPKFEIYSYKGYSIVRVTPWPGAKILPFYKKKGQIHKAVYHNQIPIKSIIVTSTTHVPALEMLGVEILRSLVSRIPIIFHLKNTKTH